MVSSDALESVIGPTVNGLGYELWGIERQRSPRGLLLRVYIDHPEGIAVTDCERVSKQVSDLLAAESAVAEDYQLEISSPGMDRQLFTVEQYQRFCGSPVQIKLRIPQQGRRNLQGILREANERSVIVECDDVKIELTFGTIDRTRIVPEWPEKGPAKRGATGRKHTG